MTKIMISPQKQRRMEKKMLAEIFDSLMSDLKKKRITSMEIKSEYEINQFADCRGDIVEIFETGATFTIRCSYGGRK